MAIRTQKHRVMELKVARLSRVLIYGRCNPAGPCIVCIITHVAGFGGAGCARQATAPQVPQWEVNCAAIASASTRKRIVLVTGIVYQRSGPAQGKFETGRERHPVSRTKLAGMTWRFEPEVLRAPREHKITTRGRHDKEIKVEMLRVVAAADKRPERVNWKLPGATCFTASAANSIRARPFDDRTKMSPCWPIILRWIWFCGRMGGSNNSSQARRKRWRPEAGQQHPRGSEMRMSRAHPCPEGKEMQRGSLERLSLASLYLNQLPLVQNRVAAGLIAKIKLVSKQQNIHCHSGGVVYRQHMVSSVRVYRVRAQLWLLGQSFYLKGLPAMRVMSISRFRQPGMPIRGPADFINDWFGAQFRDLPKAEETGISTHMNFSALDGGYQWPQSVSAFSHSFGR